MRKPEAGSKPRASAAAVSGPAVCTCLALRQAARQVTQLYDRHLAETGLRSTQYSILSRLGREGPMSLGRLATAVVMDRTAMGRAVRPLERDGLVAAAEDADGRKRMIALTDAGRARLAEAGVRWLAAQRAFERAYGADEAAALRAQMAAVVQAVR